MASEPSRVAEETRKLELVRAQQQKAISQSQTTADRLAEQLVVAHCQNKCLHHDDENF